MSVIGTPTVFLQLERRQDLKGFCFKMGGFDHLSQMSPLHCGLLLFYVFPFVLMEGGQFNTFICFGCGKACEVVVIISKL